jgi:hypothetical protein
MVASLAWVFYLLVIFAFSLVVAPTCKIVLEASLSYLATTQHLRMLHEL